MRIKDFERYFDYETMVTIKTKDELEYTGIFTGINNFFVTTSGHDELELDIGNYYLGIEISDIISVTPETDNK